MHKRIQTAGDPRSISPFRRAASVSSWVFSVMTLCGFAAAAIYEPGEEAPSAILLTENATATTEAPAVVTPIANTTTPAAMNTGASTWTSPPTVDRSGTPLQCAIYARQRSGVQLTGAARTWYSGAAGRYQRAREPQVGAVMAMGGTSSGHVAVVARILNDREILIDHANWLGQGEIQTGALARDVSEAGDWSSVVVWHIPSNGLGIRPYPVEGFILPTPVASPT
jgi:surface antigen